MFYGTEKGDKLVDDRNYPDSIKVFLQQEKQLLLSKIPNHDVIIEVGCMEARNMEPAIKLGKKYIGIDIVQEYINIANEIVEQRKLTSICEFLCVDAEQLDQILKQSELLKTCNAPLFFFPFNSFGNMNNISKVLNSMRKIKNADFIIFSYDTDKNATQERYAYYNNCNYKNLLMTREENGIRFTAEDGLNSMAYNEVFLNKCIRNAGMRTESRSFANIGIAYFISTREKDIGER